MHYRKARLTLCAGAFALVAGLAAPAYAQSPAPQNATASHLTAAITAADNAPAVFGRAAYLEDAATGKELFSKAADKRLPIASITKVMTAYVVLENAKPTDVVRITSEDVRHAEDGGATTADLRPGDRVSVKELLYGLMLPSGADAAHALARTYGPGVDAFTKKMNDTARALGMRDSEYVNADGLPGSGGDGYSTARDQAKLATKALDKPLLKQVVGTRQHDVAGTSEHGSYSWTNTNKLLANPGAIGLKTGFTRAAGFTLSFAGEQGGQRLVGVILGESDSSRRFSTAQALLDWASSR
ncbi:D-alanyl-D-alanine carboxypeptidase family protein [Nonomuraea sp. NPDC005983]|uniref:D-alanyl-D-alanine carboxypeptidase family protein n=1 Tax=Nonomuraea sp. NPDC005983 TaxID=3155595 RepID=UPI0033B499E8